MVLVQAAGAATVTIGNDDTGTDLLDFDGTAYNSSGAAPIQESRLLFQEQIQTLSPMDSDVKFSDGTIVPGRCFRPNC